MCDVKISYNYDQESKQLMRTSENFCGLGNSYSFHAHKVIVAAT